MTLHEFMFNLEAADLKWFYLGDPNDKRFPPTIRADNMRFGTHGPCPICAVANHILGFDKYHTDAHRAAITLGLENPLISQIMLAADGAYMEDENILIIRHRLEEICGPKPFHGKNQKTFQLPEAFDPAAVDPRHKNGNLKFGSGPSRQPCVFCGANCVSFWHEKTGWHCHRHECQHKASKIKFA